MWPVVANRQKTALQSRRPAGRITTIARQQNIRPYSLKEEGKNSRPNKMVAIQLQKFVKRGRKQAAKRQKIGSQEAENRQQRGSNKQQTGRKQDNKCRGIFMKLLQRIVVLCTLCAFQILSSRSVNLYNFIIHNLPQVRHTVRVCVYCRLQMTDYRT